MMTETRHVAFMEEDILEKKVVQSDFFEVASSCKETDYSLNPLHKKDFFTAAQKNVQRQLTELTGKQIKRMKVESTRKSITRNLKEENDRAMTNATQNEKELPEICRRSPRITKMKPASKN
jgi:hypothetical protein